MTGPARTSRRDLLVRIAAVLSAAPLARAVTACGATSSGAGAASPLDAGGGGGEAGGGGGGLGDAGVPWATGGTASMTAKASYPDPFASGAPSSCPATGTLTGGPCYDADSEVLSDISYGQPGLPTRMVFQVLDASCKPLSGATVDVWHVSPTGKYSGNDTAHENVSFCTGNDTEYVSHLYYRGKQVTDANGLVAFDTCFPGWYPGRTLHVHFTITSGAKSLTSQFVFDDALGDVIVGTQPIYKDRGARDTTNTTDSVVSASTFTSFLFETRQMPDGALLAWKSIIVS